MTSTNDPCVPAPPVAAAVGVGGCVCACTCAEPVAGRPAQGDGVPAGAAEVPLLADVLAAAREVDRAVARMVHGLMELDEHQIAEVLTGLPLEQWLAIAGRRTRADRRMLLTTAQVLRRLPSLAQAFLVDRTVSWAQTRTVVLQVHRLPRRFDDAVDASVAATIRACAQDDPDTLSSAVSRALRSLDDAPAPASPVSPPVEEFLAIQPRLDGSGGQLFGELGPLALATVDAALTPAPDQLRDVPGPTRGAASRGRARRLVELCDGALAGRAGPEDPAGDDDEPDDGGGDPSLRSDGSRRSRPQLVLRVDLATLLDRDDLPGELLTRLTGGKLWVDAGTARKLVAERGADLRTVILEDTGAVVGVGRRTRVPTDWLRDATLALHDTCSAPGCLHPARSCDLDHARPWQPTEAGQPGGRTDIDQLAPLCRRHNRTKEAAGWQVDQRPDGTRRWHHPGLDVAVATRPATWQPPGASLRATTDSVASGDPPPAPDLAREGRARYDPCPGGRHPPGRSAPPQCRGIPALRGPPERILGRWAAPPPDHRLTSVSPSPHQRACASDGGETLATHRRRPSVRTTGWFRRPRDEPIGNVWMARRWRTPRGTRPRLGQRRS